jgi:hypothetical protein
LGSSPSDMLSGRLAPIGTPTEQSCRNRIEFFDPRTGRH